MYQMETSINENEWHILSEAKLNETQKWCGKHLGKTVEKSI